MAKKQEGRVFHISVVGFSGTEKDKGVEGIGKSCFCNRFVRPLQDDYRYDHISVLSQSDFSGRVVNNDHFLYWGETTRTADEGTEVTFHIIEQTEFIDDTSFMPFRSGKTEAYFKRCAAVKIHSAEKLMYICKNQLGLEHEFEEKLLPEGKMSIDGFLCLFDVSTVHQRPFERQLEYTNYILNNLAKAKKPIVFVTTKNDRANEMYVREVEKLVNKFKGNIMIVETSALLNVNVDLAFLTLSHLIDRTKGRPKIATYAEAAKARNEIYDVATEAYKHLVRSKVTDHRALWMPVYRQICGHPDYIHFVDLCGTEHAKKLFRQHTTQLREEFIQRRVELYLDKLKKILTMVLPDLSTIADRSWPTTLRWLQRQDFFSTYFIEIPEGQSWWEPEFLESQEERIPLELLERSQEAEAVFQSHVTALRQHHKRSELRRQFKQLLEDNHNVCCGNSLNEVAIFFLGRECFTILSEEDKAAIYEQHQEELRERAKVEFQELLLENAEFFAKYNGHETLSAEDFQEMMDHMQNEPRYRALSRLEEERKVIWLRHMGFIQCPSRDHCPFGEGCREAALNNLLCTKAHRPEMWGHNRQFRLDLTENVINLVILGANGLADTFAHDIRLQCIEDDYTLDGQEYSLDYRPIDSDVNLPQNSFRTTDFMPHGCFCVYNSAMTLDYLRDSLEKTMLSDIDQGAQLPFHGLPVVIVLASDSNLNEKTLLILRELGQKLAERLQCAFIDIPSNALVESSSTFAEQQVALAMHALISSIKHRSSLISPWQIAESIEPDLRILMCIMCGDEFSVQIPTASLLMHQCCYVTSDKYPTLTLESYLGGAKRQVEVTLVSYHAASQVQDDLYHGYVLVYAAKRKASLVALSTLVSTLPAVPARIIAIAEGLTGFTHYANDVAQCQLQEGQLIADRMHASFAVHSMNSGENVSYTSFFKEAWDRKPDTESAFTFSGEDEEVCVLTETMDHIHSISRRPPALLPKPPRRHDSFGLMKSSTSNSTEDSEPVYDQLHLDRCQSDSEENGASSASPPNCDNPYSAVAGEEVYSEIAPRDTEQLLKSSQVKSRRNMYAERYRKSFPSASTSSFASSSHVSSSLVSSSFREDSTDTDTSTRSPKSIRPERGDVEPRYQFRKSNSMKLALKEDHEGWSVQATLNQLSKKLTKSSTLPPNALPPGAGGTDAGWYEEPVYDSTVPLLSQMENPAYDQSCRKPKHPKPRPLETGRFQRNVGSFKPHGSHVKAPLATPEQIEIGEYMQVYDALPPSNYASVQNALPAGRIQKVKGKKPKEGKGREDGSDSDSECSSLERRNENIYARVNRRPTPHKKKHKPRYSDSSLPPPLPPYTEDRHVLLHQDQLDKVRSNSPSSEGTGDEQHTVRKQKKRRSFRREKKKKPHESDSSLVTSPPWSDSEMGVSSISSMRKTSAEDDGTSDLLPHKRGDDEEDGSNWMQKLRLKTDKDPEKQKRKEEKKAKEDEKRKQKEEEKLKKEQQKLQRKQKKKDGKLGTLTSQSSMSTLEVMVQSEMNLVPLFVEKCVNYIEEEGLNVEGIYRVPGNQAQVEQLFERFKEDPAVDFHSLDIPVNAVATALKMFFRDLAEPVIPNYYFNELLETCDITDRSTRFASLRVVVRKLPDVNFEVLKYIVAHICKVAAHSSENSMDSKNLAICFWPTLLRPEFNSFEKMTLVSKLLEDIILTLIEQYEYFFLGENEV